MHRYLLTNSLIILSLIASTVFATNKLDSAQIMQMQDFHLQQATAKLTNKQFAQAWGDFAYLLCHIPNHLIALKHMLILAPYLDKQSELAIYFEKAIKAFPQDQNLLTLYENFLKGYLPKK